MPCSFEIKIQCVKDKCYMISLICKQNKLKRWRQTHGYKEQIDSYQKGVGLGDG